MKKLSILILILGLFHFGCLYTPPSSDNSSLISVPKSVQVDVSSMNHYSNAEYGISFYYPADWDLAPEYMDKMAVDDANVNQSFVFIMKNSNKSTNMNIAAFNDSEMAEICVTNVLLCDNAIANGISDDVDYYKKIDSGVKIVAGKRAYFNTRDVIFKPMAISYEGEITNITTSSTLDRNTQVIFSNNDVTFVITFASRSDAFLQDEADFDAILSTMEFSD